MLVHFLHTIKAYVLTLRIVQNQFLINFIYVLSFVFLVIILVFLF